MIKKNSVVRIAYVVPTMDRPVDLRNLLNSLSQQSVSADQIVIVDGSNPPIENVLAEFPELKITYVRVYPPSLAKQRNAGMAALNEDITVAGYLDDDLVLEPDATQQMVTFWEAADSSVGGAAFSVLNQPQAISNRLARLFFLDHPTPGKMLASGFQSQIPPLYEVTPTDWLYGGAAIWSRAVVDAYQYDEWYIGHGYLEDVDFSHRVRQEYTLFVIGAAQVNHYSHPILIEKNFDIGKQQIINRLYFIRKIGGFSKFRTAQAFCGLMLFNFASSIRHIDTAGLRRFYGNFIGLISALKGRDEQIGGFYK